MRSPLRRLLSFAVLACLSAAAFVRTTVVAPMCAAARAVKVWVFDGFELAAANAINRHPLPVLFAQARAFVLRLAKRERPQVSGSWRMCPST